MADRYINRTGKLDVLVSLYLSLNFVATHQTWAQTPEILRVNLDMRPVVTGLVTPTTMAFLAKDDLLVLEKNTGQVQRIVGGMLHSTLLDLAVNFASERGLLGIALRPAFPDNDDGRTPSRQGAQVLEAWAEGGVSVRRCAGVSPRDARTLFIA